MTRPNRPRSRPGGPDPAFECERCHSMVPGSAPGTANRNHCPACLWSLHVDMKTGDRRSGCRGLMEPIAVWTRRDGEWSVIHRCQRCGLLRANRIGGDDDPVVLLSIAVRPLARPAFPLDAAARAVTGQAREANHE